MDELRKRAEARIEDEREELQNLSPEEITRLVHDLRTHQIELEIQNEDLRQAQQDLAAARDRYLDLYELAPVGYLTVSDKGLIAEANLTVADLLGVERGGLLKAPLSQFVAPEDQDAYYFHRRTHDDPGQKHSFEARMLRAGADPFWASIRCIPVKNPDGAGAPWHRAAIADISERKRAEEELREANRQLAQTLSELEATQQKLAQQERLRALGVLASGVAHDFNNSLAIIQGLAEVLSLHGPKYEDPSELPRYLDLIRTECDKAAEVVKRVNQFYRPRVEDEPLVPVRVNRVVEDVIALTEPRWKTLAESRGVQVDVRSDLEDVPVVAGNQHELEQALANLVLNAVEAIEGEGAIVIRTRAAGNLVQIEVADTGSGMTEEVRRRGFDPFFTTKEDPGGGLGLASVHGIIERHGGSISVESRLNEGTTFRISLPVGGTEEDPPRPEPRVDRASASSLRVLLVEDKASVRLVFSEFLSLAGHEVEEAADGREGLDRFRSQGFDVVITDLSMPEMNGNELALAIRHQSPETPVILMTGFGEEALALGTSAADIVLRKPVREAQILEALATVCRVQK